MRQLGSGGVLKIKSSDLRLCGKSMRILNHTSRRHGNQGGRFIYAIAVGEIDQSIWVT
jgi:hypothetical protein